MKFLRLLLTWFLTILLLGTILVGIALSPVLQTWGMQYALRHGKTVHGTVETIYAGPSSVELDKLHVTAGGGTLTLPRLFARVSVWKAIWQRKIVVNSLVAQDWTIDLSPQTAVADKTQVDGNPATIGTPAPSPTGSVKPVSSEDAVVTAAKAVYALIRSYRLPAAISVDGIDLAGKVLVPLSPDTPPVRVDVTIKGGGLTATHPGDFAITANAADMQLDAISINAEGSLTVTMNSPETFDRFQVDATITTGDRTNRIPWWVVASVARDPVGAAGSLDVHRGRRVVTTIDAQFEADSHRWTGTWQSDLTADDIRAFRPKKPLPIESIKGQGQLEADAILSEIKLEGQATALTQTGVPWVASWSGPPEPVNIAATFNGVHQGHTLRIEAAQATLSTQDAHATLAALQAFSVDELNGIMTVPDPTADWLQVRLQAIPLAWADEFTDLFTVRGGDLSGVFAIQMTTDGWVLHQSTPLLAHDVAVSSHDRMLACGFDLAVSLQANTAGDAWQVGCAPLEVRRGESLLGTVTASATRSAEEETDQLVKVTGTWQADLKAAGWPTVVPVLARVRAQTATGDFGGTIIGSSSSLEGKLTVTGRDPANTVSSTYAMKRYGGGSGTLQMPINISLGPIATELTANLTWRGYDSTPIELDVTGNQVALAPLLRLAKAAGLGPVPSLATATGVTPPPTKERDQIPFWGETPARVTVRLDSLQAKDREFTNVGGTLHISRDELKLMNAHAAQGRLAIEPVEGTITFDATAATPYQLNATAALKGLDAAVIFGPAMTVYKQQVEGRFDVAATVTGHGTNLADLGSRLQSEFQLDGKNGITRLLQTHVSQVLPPPPETSRAVDVLVGVGSTMGRFFGAKDALAPGEVRLPPNKEAVLVLDAVLGVVGYDSFTIQGHRDPDGRIKLNSIEMITPEARLTGSGEIGHVTGRRLLEQPFSAELQLAVKDDYISYLTEADLLSTKQDELGYTLLVQPSHWGGTLGKIDPTGWRELLSKAAQREPKATKKDR